MDAYIYSKLEVIADSYGFVFGKVFTTYDFLVKRHYNRSSFAHDDLAVCRHDSFAYRSALYSALPVIDRWCRLEVYKLVKGIDEELQDGF